MSAALRGQPPEVRNAVASGWMKRGIALLDENTVASLTASLRWFEQAILVRRSLPLRESAWYRYVLAAAWMNRGDALTRLGTAENLSEAVRSYDQALRLLKTLEIETNPLFRKRLALAWMNRGITLHAQETPVSLRAALASFEEAIAVVREHPEHRQILASALTNRGNALLGLAPPSPTLARASAEAALTLIVDTERHEVVAAEIGLKARHVLCRAIASQLALQTMPIETENLVAAATDAVDEGMELARHWEVRNEGRFRDLAAELFRFGARAYQIHQSHFLTEFLLENLDPLQSRDAFPVDPRLHAVANEAITRAFGDFQRDGFRSVNTPHFHRFLKTLRQLRITQTRLEELRRACPVGAAPAS